MADEASSVAEPPAHVFDRHGVVWRLVHDGGMATRADYTGIETIGIRMLEFERGPLRPVINLEELDVGRDEVLILTAKLPLEDDEVDEMHRALRKDTSGRVWVVDGTRCDMRTERINPLGIPDDEVIVGVASLALFLGGSDDSWTGSFLRLVAKSDPAHRERLRMAFPLHVHVLEVWQRRAPLTVAELTTECRA